MIITETRTVNQTPAYKRRAGLPLDPDVEITIHTVTGTIQSITPRGYDSPALVIDGDTVQVPQDLAYWDGAQWDGQMQVGDRVTGQVEDLPNGEWLAGSLRRVEEA